MANLWYKIKNSSQRKKHTLHSVGAGCILFAILLSISYIYPSSICLSQNIFGISCPGCGMTRAFKAILQMDFANAYKYNVFSLPLFAGILVYVVLAIVDIIFDKNFIYKIEKRGLPWLIAVGMLMLTMTYCLL